VSYLPEYALQPWRLAQGKFWVTSISVIYHANGQLRVGERPVP
jgi:hypothetical protein